MKELTITAAESGQRFDKFLGKYLPNAGRSFLYKMLRKKNITLNGKKATGAEILSDGDKVKLFFSDETFSSFAGTVNIPEYDLDFESLIVYEDEDVIFLNKPAGMLSQKAASGDISLCEYLVSYLYHGKKLSSEDLRAFTPSVTNRLDRNTSGLITAGKTLRGLQLLSEAFRERKAEKYYLTIVKGHVGKNMRLEGYLAKDETSNVVSVSREAGKGDYIRTEAEPVSYAGDFSLLKVQLFTGKTHQIRAAMAAMGYPVLGDPKYGVRYPGVKRQMLHSYQLVFEGNTYTAELPGDFIRAAGKLGLL